MQATGEFQVSLKPLEFSTKGQDGINLGRMSINKAFSGDLAATSQGEMLSAMTKVKGSAGYVAIEQVSGVLAGKKGSFVLQHFGIMQGELSHLILEVVPDSGSGELIGLTGVMTIKIENGQHTYIFEYQIN